MSGPYSKIAGAPECHALDWDEEGLVPATEYIHHLKRYLFGVSTFRIEQDNEKETGQDLPVWLRKPSMLQSAWHALPLYPKHLPTGLS